MEHRLGKLEGDFHEIKTDVKIMGNTLSEISATLREFRLISTEVALIKQQQAVDTSRMSLYIKKQEILEDNINKIIKLDARQEVKLSTLERVGWIVFTLGLSIASHFISNAK